MMRGAFAMLLLTGPCAASAYLSAASPHRLSTALRAVRPDVSNPVGHYGNPKCPCVGLDNVKGFVSVAAAKATGGKFMMPTEFGGSCSAWDQRRHPSCEQGTERDFLKDGDEPAFCSQPYCYVDPCNCDIPETPVVSSFIPAATFLGHPLYYSYATCGGYDAWTATHHEAACVNQKTQEDCGKLDKCGWDGERCAGKEALGVCKKAVVVARARDWQFGAEDCNCVGNDGVRGTIEAELGDGKKLAFPADYGATCKAHEAAMHPLCTGTGKRPAWCDKSWCFVDPCKCKLASSPKVTLGWLGADVRSQGGKNLYYSYETCGNEDLFTTKYNLDECANKQTSAVCRAAGTPPGSKCFWRGNVAGEPRCVGKELAETGFCEPEQKSSIAKPLPLRPGAKALAPPRSGAKDLAALAALAPLLAIWA